MKASIRLRLLLSAGLVLGLFAIAITFALLAAFANTLEEAMRQRLAADARAVTAAMHVVDDQLRVAPSLENERFDQVRSSLVALIYNREGELLWRSSDARAFQPGYMPAYVPDEAVFTRVEVEDRKHDYFIHDLDVRVDDWGYSIITADSTLHFDTSMRTYRRQLGLWLSVSLASLVLLLVLGLAYALSPLQRFRRQMMEVERGERQQLDGRYPAEIAAMAYGLNRLLTAERNRQERYQTSVGDLAHGLKTPLAVVAEVSRTLEEEHRQVLDEQVQRMNQLVQYHLQRARPAHLPWAQTPLQLQSVLEKLCTSLEKVYRDKSVNWQVEADGVRLLLVEPQALEMFGNLLENAFRLCLGEVRVGVRQQQDEWAYISIEDDGPGVPSHLRQRIMARGSRADLHNGGHGIGLAVVVDMLNELGGELIIEDAELGGAAFVVVLPQSLLVAEPTSR